MEDADIQAHHQASKHQESLAASEGRRGIGGMVEGIVARQVHEGTESIQGDQETASNPVGFGSYESELQSLGVQGSEVMMSLSFKKR
jgi:hypothetical protein